MDARELKEKATQLFSKGKFAKAAETYEEYCKADRKDHQARLRCGDAWAKAGKKDKAVAAYALAAEGFARDGFLPRAIAASKLVLEFDPSHTAVQKMLADLYAQKRGSPGARPGSTSGLRAHGAPLEVSRAVEAPGTAAGFTHRKDALDIEAPPPGRAPAAAVVAAPAPAVKQREALDLPEYELPLDTPTPAAQPQTGHQPARRTAALEIDVGVEEPPREPDALEEGGIEIELGSGSSVAGEEEVPIEGQPIPDVDQLPAGLQPVSPEPIPQPAPSGPSFELTVEVEAAPAPQPAEPLRSNPSAVYELTDAVDEPPAAPVYELGDEGETLEGVEGLELAQPVSAAPGASAPPRPSDVAEAPSVPSARPPPVEIAPPPPDIAPIEAAPPGLRPRRPNEIAPKASAAVPAASAVSSPLAEPSSDLERGLKAFMEFDPDGPAPVVHAPAPAPALVSKPAATSFTELELEGDSLLHAVETAAQTVLPETAAQGAPTEEPMEAPEEARVEPGALPKIPLFSDLPEDAFIALFEECPLLRFDAGQLVFEQGDKADALFVICAGKARVFRVDEKGSRRDLVTLEEGSFFGELALLSEAPRSASVEAAEDDTQVLSISADTLKALSTRFPVVATALKKFSRQRMLTNLLNQAALFAPFSRSDRRELVQKFRAREARRGDVLVREGQPSDGLYVVLYGEVEVEAKGRRLATLKEGEVFGEISLLQRSPATATVRATRHSSLLRLPKPDFDSIILSHPQVLEHVAELVDERLKATAAAAMT
jgi:CRP-like cAMP-binding protein